MLGGELLLSVDVDAMLEVGDRRRNGLGAELHQIRSTRQHRLGAHPNYVRGELVGDFGPRLRAAQHVAARDVEFVGQGDRHGVAGLSRVRRAVGDEDALDFRDATGIGDRDLLADRDLRPPATVPV